MNGTGSHARPKRVKGQENDSHAMKLSKNSEFWNHAESLKRRSDKKQNSGQALPILDIIHYHCQICKIWRKLQINYNEFSSHVFNPPHRDLYRDLYEISRDLYEISMAG